MSDVESLAEKVHTEAPWWSAVPVLAAAIVGVPSFLAVAALFYVAQHVSASLRELIHLNQTQITLMNEHLNFTKRNYEVVVKFMDDDLRCQYVTCLNSAQTSDQRKACVSPAIREKEYGIVPPRSSSNDPPNP